MEHFYQNIDGWSTGITELYKYVIDNCIDNDLHFIEVGVWKGRSACFMAVEIANSGKNISFDCIDDWRGDPKEESHWADPILKENRLYEHFLENISPVTQYIKPIRLKSLEAVSLYEDSSVDFIFIDASHDYDSVKEDIVAWLPKLKPGGILAGHDFFHAPVRTAVLEMLPNARAFNDMCWIYHNKFELDLQS